MKKITILALHLSTGGIEKAIANLSNMLAPKYKVEIICNYKLEEAPAFFIDERVEIRYLMPNLKPNAKEFKMALKHFRLIKVFQEALKAIKILYLRRKLMIQQVKLLSCDIAISTRDIYNKILGKYGSDRIIKMAQEHNNNGDSKYVKKIVKSLKNIDYFLPVSKQLTNLYKAKLEGRRTKCMYIPHCLSNYPKEVSSLNEKNIISIGRLSSEKGFLDLIDVFELVHKRHPDWHLNIAGDGQQRDEIEEKIQKKDLTKRVSLLGFQKEEEIQKQLEASSIYVMTSFQESFGLVLIEAESYGIPILAFDSAKGPTEIIEHEKNGFLIANRNKQEMADKICKLIENYELRKRMGKVAREASAQYKMEEVQKIWYGFIEDI